MILKDLFKGNNLVMMGEAGSELSQVRGYIGLRGKKLGPTLIIGD